MEYDGPDPRCTLIKDYLHRMEITLASMSATEVATFVAALEPVLTEIGERADPQHALLVSVAGSVGVGKTVFASKLSAVLNTAQPSRAQTISTDGFLLPNVVLDARGLLDRKGFPETYDHDAIHAFIRALRSGAWPVPVSKYSHELFDIVEGSPLEPSEVVIVEGINALQTPFAESVDLRMYLHTDESIVKEWFVARLKQFIVDAESAPGGFYDRFVGYSADERDDFARHVWDAINLPNLREHIAPSRANADWVVEFDAHHRIVELTPITR